MQGIFKIKAIVGKKVLENLVKKKNKLIRLILLE